MDYKELVESLRFMAKQGKRYGMAVIAMGEAADAIEQLQKSICPHYIRNVHDRGDDSLCDKYKCEVNALPKWIPASEPPQDERNVFICHGRPDFKTVCIGYYDHTNKLFYEDRNWFASILYDPLYWCEMPRLPVEEKS